MTSEPIEIGERSNALSEVRISEAVEEKGDVEVLSYESWAERVSPGGGAIIPGVYSNPASCCMRGRPGWSSVSATIPTHGHLVRTLTKLVIE